jgi:hypothetical protein
VADESKTYTQDEVDAMFAERLATETSGLKKNRDDVLKEAKAAKAALAAYEGVDPEEFKKLKAAADEAERKKATAEGNFASLEKQLIEKHGVELEKERGRAAKLQKALEQRLVQAELTSAIAKHRGDADLLLPIAKDSVRVRETETGFEAYVADKDGNARIADGKGTPMTFDDLVTQELLVKYPRAFDGTGSSGGGASKSTGSAGSSRVIPAGDNDAFIANLDGIAKGTTKVAA